MYTGLHVKYPVFLPDFNEKQLFSTDFGKNNQTPNFVKIHPLAAELFITDRQRDTQTDIYRVFHDFKA